jgi:hypothetical protein
MHVIARQPSVETLGYSRIFAFRRAAPGKMSTPGQMRSMKTNRLAALLLAGAMLSLPACEPEQRGAPVVTSRPVAEPQQVESQPAEPPATTRPAPDPNSAHVEIRKVTDPQQGWLRIEAIKPNAEMSQITGRFSPADNRLVIDTQQVQRFSIDLGALPVRWDRRVVLRIDQISAELSRKSSPIVHFEVTPAGDWIPVRP